MQQIKRGDIYYADLNPYIGSEQGGVRPILIVQNDIGNKYSSTIIAAVITSQTKTELPTHVKIKGQGLNKNSTICLEQIRTIDKCRLREYVGRLDDELMKKVEDAIDISFGIQCKREGHAVADLNILAPVEFKNIRVLTTQQIADGYGTAIKRISENFQRNRERYQEGTHFFKLEGEELRNFKESAICGIAPTVNYYYLWTEKGALLHAKSLNTDKAWEVYQNLVDTYFRVNQLAAPQTQIQILQQAISVLAEQEKELAVTKQIALVAQSEATAAKETIKEIKESLAELPKDQWRKYVNTSISDIVKSGKSKHNYEGVWNESYRLLEEKSRADLGTRVRNKRRRLSDAGATKSVIDSFCKLDAIEEDKYLKEIYTNIIQKLRIKYLI